MHSCLSSLPSTASLEHFAAPGEDMRRSRQTQNALPQEDDEDDVGPPPADYLKKAALVRM